MEIKKAPFIPYSEKQFNSYKTNLTDRLIQYGLDCDQIIAHPTAKSFIAAYAENEVINERKDLSRKLQGITMKFTHMDIQVGKENVRTFPIINEYKGHHIMKTYYFYEDGATSTMKVGCIEVNPSPLIIP